MVIGVAAYAIARQILVSRIDAQLDTRVIHSAATDLERPLAALCGTVNQLIAPHDHRAGADYDLLRTNVIAQIEHITHTITALVDAGRTPPIAHQ